MEGLEILELGAGGGEKLLAGLDMVIHRSADVEQKQDLDLVAALGLELQIEQAGVVRGRPDRAGNVQLGWSSLARKAAQPAEPQPHATGSELHFSIESAEFAAFPALGRGSFSRPAVANPHALGVVAVGAEG